MPQNVCHFLQRNHTRLDYHEWDKKKVAATLSHWPVMWSFIVGTTKLLWMFSLTNKNLVHVPVVRYQMVAAATTNAFVPIVFLAISILIMWGMIGRTLTSNSIQTNSPVSQGQSQLMFIMCWFSDVKNKKRWSSTVHPTVHVTIPDSVSPPGHWWYSQATPLTSIVKRCTQWKWYIWRKNRREMENEAGIMNWSTYCSTDACDTSRTSVCQCKRNPIVLYLYYITTVLVSFTWSLCSLTAATQGIN